MASSKEIQLGKLGTWTRNNGKRYENILILTCALGLVLRYFDSSYGGILFTISMYALAAFYYLSGYTPVEEATEIKLKLFTNRLGGWGCSIALIAILFKLMSYE